MKQQETVPDFIERLSDKPLNGDLDITKFLEHYGKKGMRWGVRKQIHIQPGRDGQKLSADFKKTVPLRNRKPQHLSNKQIQTVNARINLEQAYRRLNPSKVDRGHNAVKDIMAVVGTAAAVYTLANSPFGKAGAAFLKDAFKTTKILKVIK